MLSNEELDAVLTVGHETRSVEFKSAGNLTDKAFVALVARAALALANQRDGGNIVLGIDDRDPRGARNGLDEIQLRDWKNLDAVADKLNRYADPPLTLRIEGRQHPNGNPVVIIEVSEFSEIPSLCMKDFGNTLALGQLYTRSLRKPESSMYHTQNEMREVLDLATQKGVRRFMETARGSGFFVGPGEPALAAPSHEKQFREQIDAMAADPLLVPITAQAHFRHLIYPQSFEAGRVPYEELKSCVRDSTVRLRGWPFPFTKDPEHGDDFVGETTMWQRHNETWRFFTSGLFADFKAIGDWPDDWDSFGGNSETTGNMPAWFPLLHFTEALEFAARLRSKLALAEPMVVRFEAANMAGRKLVVADDNRSGFHHAYVYRSPSWRSEEILITDEAVLSGTRPLAAEAAKHLLARFGWEGVTTDLLEGIQASALNA
ncbi:AlbA family DNA-binding domain-containing protein [Pseudarthrobacter oxydans]|uniref:AlbA family DNA-binding domain-containing protein n=1 Tax=Pseudarthrobacter oxydans TaxID=1671 RepID=UPI0037FD497B